MNHVLYEMTKETNNHIDRRRFIYITYLKCEITEIMWRSENWNNFELNIYLVLEKLAGSCRRMWMILFYHVIYALYTSVENVSPIDSLQIKAISEIFLRHVLGVKMKYKMNVPDDRTEGF